MADTKTEIQQRVKAELGNMNTALVHQQLAYQAFLVSAQEFEWEAAEACRDRCAACCEAAMDAFARACRAQEEGQRHGTG